jgi:hypothetical protein
MKKKRHFKISSQNKLYDQFYLVNYLEWGKNWHDHAREAHGAKHHTRDDDDDGDDDDDANDDDANDDDDGVEAGAARHAHDRAAGDGTRR